MGELFGTELSATQQGHKKYFHGTTYNGGIAPTITGQAGFSTTRSWFMPYQSQDGSWGMRFNIRLTQTSQAAADLSINGVTFLKTEAVLVSAVLNNVQPYVGRTTISTNSMVIRCNAADTDWSIIGDVELTAKPSWAY